MSEHGQSLGVCDAPEVFGVDLQDLITRTKASIFGSSTVRINFVNNDRRLKLQKGDDCDDFPCLDSLCDDGAVLFERHEEAFAYHSEIR